MFKPGTIIFIGLIAAAGLITACAGQANIATPSPTLPPLPPTAGTILVDGSSTVGPITMRVADEFNKQHPDINLRVDISGTGGGFKKFCAGKTDISNASRPIKDAEATACQQNGVEYIELPVAFDGLAVVVNLNNSFAVCLTTQELRRLWQPEAEGKVTTWQHVRPAFPNQTIRLYGPGTDSGTYDYFTEAIVGQEGVSRNDFLGSENDYTLVEGVARDATALGFFGYAYYDENRDKLKLLAIDHGHGCVEPNTETVAKGLYQPLSRPLFIYINRAKIDSNGSINLFVEFYLAHAAQLVDDVGYIPLTDPIYELAKKRYANHTTGSVFEESGAAVGVSLAELLIREK